MENKSNGIVLGVVAVAIAAIALGAAVFGGDTQPVNQNVGGERAGLQEFLDGIKAGDINVKWASAELPVATNQVLIYANRTGHDVIADFGSMVILTGETASSTYNVSIFATTSSSIATQIDFATLGENSRSLIHAATIATSSTATTTSSGQVTFSKGNGPILVPTGSSIFGYIQQNSGCLKGTGACEQATSTARGFNPIFSVRLYAAKAEAPSL
jgi:hypothetical protein